MSYSVLATMIPRPIGEGLPPTGLDLPEAGRPPHLWLARADEYHVGPAVLALLSPEEARRRAQFVRETDRHRFTVAHVVLRQLVGAYLGQDPAEVAIVRRPCPRCGQPDGRPTLHGSNLHFSLSHSDDLSLYAFARSPVGVDIEAMPARETSDELHSSLHPLEQVELAVLPEAERTDAFLRCWTRKEACLKGMGTGLAHGIKLPYVGSWSLPRPVEGWLVSDVGVEGGYRAAVAESLL
ncbi:4'-phosphopantetheinyl transferase family protein [Streptomyces sp. NPDC058279]|uniref:4'-phosphopantetheinyl transferase family protein n=1 Tax=Streptomyces sp. NPDC058279 TaxID=3346418 RepID=UPI0036E43B07